MTMTAQPVTPSSAKAGGPTASLRTVTPEMAATWLGANSHNRKVRKATVSSYARDMAAGNWTLNGEAIQISASGVLLNGQHRLHAIIEAGVTLPLVVVTNLPDEAQNTIDTGIKRNLGDALTLDGYPNGTTLAAIATFSLQVQYGKGYKASDIEKRRIIENDDTLRWVVTNVVSGLPHRLASKTLFGYAYRVLHEIDPDDCATFFAKLGTLENLPPGSPILALHKRLVAMDRKAANWVNRTYVLSLIYLAWNAYRRGETRSMVKVTPRDDGSFTIPKPV